MSGKSPSECFDVLGAQTIEFAKIPAFLHSGEFYRSLDSDDISEVFTPFDHRQLHDRATSLGEFSNLLRVSQFWILDRIPDGVIEYCVHNTFDAWVKTAFDVLGPKSTSYQDLYTVFRGAPKNALFRAIRVGRTEIVNFLASVSVCASTYGDLAAYSARLGKLSTLRILHKIGAIRDKRTCAAAATGGHVLHVHSWH